MAIIKLPIKKLQQRLKKLKSERGTWEEHWQDVADHVLPRKNTITNKKYDGEKRTWQLLDNTGVQSNELLAGTLHGLATNPESPWFEYSTGDATLDNDDEVRKYLQECSRTAHGILNNSNFQTEVHEIYLDLPSIGTGCLLMEEDKEKYIRFKANFIAEYWIEEDRFGFVNEVHREWKWKISEILQEFPKVKLPEKLMREYEKNDEKKYVVVHAVYPKSAVDPQNKELMQFVSHYYLDECELELSVGQFQEFPYAVPRWSKAAGEKYGRSPGMTALPEIKVLNKMNETMLIGAQKVVDPPIQMPDDGFVLPVITRPGGINYYRSGTQDFIKPLFNDTRLDFGYQAMQDRRARVRDAFYIDQLKLQQGGPMMTATEVLQRKEEAMVLLGPMMARLDVEFLRLVCEKVFRIMTDRKLLPKITPTKIQGKDIRIRYSSLIAKAQRVSEGQNILRAISAIAPFVQLDPQVAQNFNGDNAARLIWNTYGAPAEGLRTMKEVAAMRAAAQQAAQAQQQQVMESQGLDDSLKFVQAAKEAKGIA